MPKQPSFDSSEHPAVLYAAWTIQIDDPKLEHCLSVPWSSSIMSHANLRTARKQLVKSLHFSRRPMEASTQLKAHLSTAERRYSILCLLQHVQVSSRFLLLSLALMSQCPSYCTERK